MLGYVLGVEAITLALVVATSWMTPITASSWQWAVILLVGSVVHSEASQWIERIREVSAENGPYTHLHSMWFFAAVLVLPVPLATGLIVITYVHRWFRVHKRRAVCYRKVFSTATVVLAVVAAQLVLAGFYPGAGQPYIAVMTGPLGVAALLAAGLVYRLVNYGLVVGAFIGMALDKPIRSALGPASDQLIIAAAVGLGYGTTIVLVNRPWTAPVLLITVLALHLGLLLPQFRAAARIDGITGLARPEWWNEQVGHELTRAEKISSSVGVLVLDLDHFKAVNDTHGHPAGNDVLRAVADAIRHSVRGYDLVARWGGEEFAVLLPGVGIDMIGLAAERIRVAVAALQVSTKNNDGENVTVGGLTVSVGAVVFPAHASTASDLLLAADAALYRAKSTGRDQVCIGTPQKGSAAQDVK
jgi:diguanylate cyclase (GGDEF)-like protein